MIIGQEWTGFEAVALQAATRESVRDYAARLGVDAKTISTWRVRGRSIRPRPVTQQLLDIALARATEPEQERFRRLISGSESPDLPPEQEPVASGIEPIRAVVDPVLFPVADDGAELCTPAGRFFGGSITTTVLVPARSEHGRVLATPAANRTLHAVLSQSHRSLVVAVVDTDEGTRSYGLDRRLVRSRLAASNDAAPLLVPPAYVLDEFSLAILWAVTNLDDALLDDDAVLAAASDRLSPLHDRTHSTQGPEAAAELSPVSRMWLGSDFCARHILSHIGRLSDAPQFWSREQRGEEASTWLLFAHKYQYLQHTAELFAATGAGSTSSRAFCIPSDTVSASWLPERVLMLLSAALIESFGIHLKVCTEPEYSAVQGFVLDSRRQAIVATWLNTDDIWQVDITDHRPTLTGFAEASGWAGTHSILTRQTPYGRLRELADYLCLDWPWLVRRCEEFADHGAAGLIQPRSRLLTLAGLDRACQFLADLEHDAR